MPLNVDDVLYFEDTLSEEECLIQQLARRYAQDKLEPRALEGNQDEVFHAEIARERERLDFWERSFLKNLAELKSATQPMDWWLVSWSALIPGTVRSCPYSPRLSCCRSGSLAQMSNVIRFFRDWQRES